MDNQRLHLSGDYRIFDGIFNNRMNNDYLSFNEEWDKDNKWNENLKWQLFEAKMANYNMSPIAIVL